MNTVDFTELGAFREGLPESERFETFRFFVARWDIVKARYIIQKANKPVGSLRVASAARVYGLDRPQTEESAVAVDETRGMSETIDTRVPVILALLKGASSPILIDGLHRLYKAYREGKETLPCYALTSEEEQLCRI
ncbi:hypothetical protein KDA_75670 [Dictyobacter alpinus]|uniref:ParB/Sulfiredoxin domain-containing protein n=1 Tax=Dictyobacter alpinus TaxID=2014873 RepID=A0A402BL38_9CHLR|nr:hypothetical protein [Dictyobacter alpinus]GCE32083.1 hypothetical protein KDA_75670 [Dictyobacter alpinus]